MKVSIIIPTHSNYEDCKNAVTSVLAQKYGDIELLVIVDNNQSLYEKLTETFKEYHSKVKFILTPRPTTVSESRNIGIKHATGDIIVFTDDDVIAAEDWIKCIVKTFKKYKAIGVSGEVLPRWEKGAYNKLPKALLWLVGCTYEGFCDNEVCRIRNGIGPNFSFRREVFKEVGYFNEHFGFAKGGRKLLQGEEAEFSIRVIKRFGNRIIHTKNAVVYHKVPKRKTKLIYLVRRSFWQGYSKAAMEYELGKDVTSTEHEYLEVVKKHILRGPSIESLLITIMTLAVGFGYITGKLRFPPKRGEPQ